MPGGRFMSGYELVSETADYFIYESNDGSHEIWKRKKEVIA